MAATVAASSMSLEGNRVLPVKFDASYEATHHMFFKPHKVKEPCEQKPNMRTLFVSNVPPWMNQDAIKTIFQVNGPVDAVYLQKTATSGPPPNQGTEGTVGYGFKFAYVVFERPSSVKKAMDKMDVKQPRLASTESKPILVGLEKWRREYNESLSLDLEALEREIEEGVASLDRVKEDEKQKAEDEFADADEDGWVTVSRHTSKKPVGKGTERAQAKVKAREARKRKRKELENFYRHQMKEKKLKRMTELREKFEKDKQRQLQMKTDRKFKPQ